MHSLVFPVFFLLILWMVKVAEVIVETSFVHFGIFPHKPEGLIGIITSPLIHADWSHLYANSVPFLTLSIGLFYFYNKISYKIFFLIYFITGTWVWFGAREAYHIGASGIVYGLASFILFSGAIRRDIRLMAISLITVFLYGSMIWGIFPIYKKISWESHLMGAVAGLIMAIIYSKEGPQRIRYAWELEPDDPDETPADPKLLNEKATQQSTLIHYNIINESTQNGNSNYVYQLKLQSWPGLKPWNDYTSYMKKMFSYRVQKISLNVGFTCPNRDGTKGRGGCTYCNNQTFNPFYCNPKKPVLKQLDEGISFFSEKYKSQQYLAYFQAYTNTYAPLRVLKLYYEQALSHPNVIGLVISTRADAVTDEILDYLQKLAQMHYVVVEYGVESTDNNTLKLINRCHTYEESEDAIKKTASMGILTGAHMILGLPGENKETIIEHAVKLSKLPLHTVKLHQLQIIKGTKMAEQFRANPEWFSNLTADAYIDLAIDFAEYLNPSIIIERFISESPQELIISPDWGGIKNFEFVNRLEKRMIERQTWQGRRYEVKSEKHKA